MTFLSFVIDCFLRIFPAYSHDALAEADRQVFGVDLLLSLPEIHPSSPSRRAQSTPLPIPKVTLLEYNASPDFHQSGQRLKTDLAEMFQGIVRISVAPFFGIDLGSDEEETSEELVTGTGTGAGSDDEAWEVGEEKWGWRLVGKGEVRGNW